MPLEKLEYSKNWENPQDFPTYEAREEQVRADIQLLFDEAKAAFNKMVDDLAADLVPFASSPAIPASTVQSAIEAVQQQIEDIALGDIPNRSLPGEKLIEGTITGAEIGVGAVGTTNLVDDSVTGDKIAPDAIDAEHIAPGAVTKEAFSTDALEDKADLVNNRVPASQLTKQVLKPSLAATYTLALSDAGAILYCSNSSAGTIFIPSNADVAFPVGAEIVVYQGEVGAVTFAAATDVSLRAPDGATPAIQKRYSSAKLVKTFTNAWNLSFGDFIPSGTIGGSMLAEGAVTGGKVATNAVTTAKIADTAVTRAKLAADVKPLSFTNVSVASANWELESTPTYADFPYRYAVALANVTANHFPQVVLSPADAMSGAFCPVVDSFEGGVYIYSDGSNEADMTIPSIVCIPVG